MHNKKMENAKDFKGSLKRLILELKPFKVLIFISLILAIFGSTLTISAPNRLSKLTDEIQKGLVINTKNLNILNESLTTSFGKDIEIDGVIVNANDQIEYAKISQNLNKNMNANDLYKALDEMPESIQKVIKPKMNIDKIKNICIMLLTIYFVSAIFNFLQSFSMTHVSNNFARKLRGRISHKINTLPLKYFDNHQTGDVLSRVTNDVDTLAQTLNNSLSALASNVTLLLGSIIMMFKTNALMSVTAIISSLLGFVFMAIILLKSQKYFVKRQEGLGKLNSHIEEIYSGLNVVKVYNGQDDANKKFDKINNEVSECSRKSGFLSGLMHPIMGFVGNFGYVAVCIVGALLTMNGKISFGVIIAFITYVRLFTMPLSSIAQEFTFIQSALASSERVFEFLDEEELSKEENKDKLLKNDVKGNIEFKNVSFKYDDNGKTIIKNFSADVKSGQKIAIVGPTGAGKTTMVNLLMKFYDIHNGDITIDGKSISDLTRENVHSLFTMVLQDTWLFEGTVKDNIRYNNSKITDKEIESVCKYIGLDHFIKTLPNNYDTVISENDNISAGQKQLLTIARGMCEKAPLLILDEATSNVDTRTEELVQKAMDKLMENKTSFIIAHRLSTIKNADLILVMNEGNIIEQGSHDELMKKDGFYAKLYNSQFEL